MKTHCFLETREGGYRGREVMVEASLWTK